MADELKQSQLARIVVPAITDAEYSKNLADAFNKINDNFKKIASLPFLQGVQGDSYQLEEYPIWEKDITENWILTEDGKVLLNSIFGNENRKDVTVNGNSFDDIRNYIKEYLDGVSPIDFFMTEEGAIVNNTLYFYVIKDDTGNIIEKQLGQYYYFVDGRLKEVGSIYNSENAGSVLSEFNDYTGFYQYKYDTEDTENPNGEYIKVEILPTIYYDQNKNDICWKFNGNETGISAIGVKGADGKDADLSIVNVDLNNENGVYSNSSTSGKVIGILDTSANNGEAIQWITNPTYFKTGKALIYMSGKIPVGNSEELVNPLSGETETNEIIINDFAYGEIVKQDEVYIAYWEPNCVFSKVLTNNSFTQYFYNMGSVSYTNNAPYFLAIPSIQNRDSSTEEAKQHAHIIKGYDGNKDNNVESLNIFHSDNAFDEVGNQQINAVESGSDKLLNIKNYNVDISKTLTSKGKITGTAGLEISGGVNIKNGGITAGGTATFYDNLSMVKDASIGGTLGVAGAVEFGSSLTVGGTLGVAGSVEFGSSLTVDGTTKFNAGIYANGDYTHSNVLFGANNPGNADDAINESKDFPVNLEEAGYPLVIKSQKPNGATETNYMVFGPGDIYALNKTTNDSGEDVIESSKLFLQHRSDYFGDVAIGRNLTVGEYSSSGGTGGNLIIKGPNGTRDKALIIKKPIDNENVADKFTVFSSGDIYTEGSANIKNGITVRNGATIYGTETQQGGTGLSVYGGIGVTGSDGGIGVVIEGGNSRENNGGIGLIVRGGTCNAGRGSTGLGIKVERGGAEISNYLSVKGTLGVTGAAIFSNNLSVIGTLGVTGAATFRNNLSVGDTLNSTTANIGTLGVTGAATFGNDLIVSNGTLSVTNTANVGTLGVTGSATIHTLGITNTLNVNGNNATINGVEIIESKVKALNGFFQTSDARLKNIIEPISVDLDKLSKLQKVYFKWKNNSSSNNEIGMIAQDVQKIYPELVYDNNGQLSLAYDKLSVIALEAIDVLYEKNKELEKRIEKLEQFIK